MEGEKREGEGKGKGHTASTTIVATVVVRNHALGTPAVYPAAHDEVAHLLVG